MATGLTAVVQQQYARVQLQLTFTTVTSATVSRVHADGTVWPVRGAAPVLVASTSGVGWVGYDHEAPLDQPITYRATSTQDATVVTSTAVTVASDPAWVGSMIWLTHPLKPSLSRLVACTGMGARTRRSRSSILPIIGRADPIAMAGTRLSPTAEMTLHTTTLTEAAALEALLADGATLCMRAPASWGSMWLYATIGDVTDEAAAGHAFDPSREWRLPYTTVAPVAGNSAGPAGITYADLLTRFDTYGQVKVGRAFLNANPNFETDVSNWFPTGGASIARDAVQSHSGIASMVVTPNGVTSGPTVFSEEFPAVAGNPYVINGWLRVSTGGSGARTVGIAWYDAAHAFLTSSNVSITPTPTVWTQYTSTLTAPASTAYAKAVTAGSGVLAASNTWRVDELSVTNPSTYYSLLL